VQDILYSRVAEIGLANFGGMSQCEPSIQNPIP